MPMTCSTTTLYDLLYCTSLPHVQALCVLCNARHICDGVAYSRQGYGYVAPMATSLEYMGRRISWLAMF